MDPDLLGVQIILNPEDKPVDIYSNDSVFNSYRGRYDLSWFWYKIEAGGL